MPKLASRIGRAAKRTMEQVELRVLAVEGRRSVKSKVARVKRLAKNALRAGVVAGVVAAATSVIRGQRKHRALFH